MDDDFIGARAERAQAWLQQQIDLQRRGKWAEDSRSFSIQGGLPMTIHSAAIRISTVALAGATIVTWGLPSQALTMKECSAKYQAAKSAGTLEGQKWSDFRKTQCGADAVAAPAAAPRTGAATPAAAPGGPRSAL